MFKEKWNTLLLRHKILIISAILLVVSIPLVMFFRAVIFVALVFFIGVVSYNVYKFVSKSHYNSEVYEIKEDDTLTERIRKKTNQVIIPIVLCFGIPALAMSLIYLAFVSFI